MPSNRRFAIQRGSIGEFMPSPTNSLETEKCSEFTMTLRKLTRDRTR